MECFPPYQGLGSKLRGGCAGSCRTGNALVRLQTERRSCRSGGLVRQVSFERGVNGRVQALLG